MHHRCLVLHLLSYMRYNPFNVCIIVMFAWLCYDTKRGTKERTTAEREASVCVCFGQYNILLHLINPANHSHSLALGVHLD